MNDRRPRIGGHVIDRRRVHASGDVDQFSHDDKLKLPSAKQIEFLRLPGSLPWGRRRRPFGCVFF